MSNFGRLLKSTPRFTHSRVSFELEPTGVLSKNVHTVVFPLSFEQHFLVGVYRVEGFRVEGLGFRSLGFRVLGFRGLGFRVPGLGFRGVEFRVLSGICCSRLGGPLV